MMPPDLKSLYGNKLAALDGEIGHVSDCYFDDQAWMVRYLVAETGSWLRGRSVLLSPHAFGIWDRQEGALSINLTRKQIENSPSIELHKPVSRQYEIDYYDYYGLPTYWNDSGMWGLGGAAVIMPPFQDGIPVRPRPHHGHGDSHLRSTKTVTGYAIHALDGRIGSLSGFLVDEKDWAISTLVVETGHWYAGKEVMIAHDKVNQVSYEDSQIFVNLTKAAIRHTAEHQVVNADA